MVDIGEILQDRNGDGVVDYVNARIYVADDPSPEEIAAAANIAARLAFESVSLDLPIAAFASRFDASDQRIPILIGRAAQTISADRGLLFADVREAERFAVTAGPDCRRRSPDEVPGQATERDARSLSRFYEAVTRVVLAPDVLSTAVIDLAARIGLETTQLRLPLVKVATSGGDIRQGDIVVGRLDDESTRIAATLSNGHGRIQAFKTTSGETALLIVGADAGGIANALRHAALRLPYVWDYGKENLSLATLERAAQRAVSRPEEPADRLIFEDDVLLTWEVDDAMAVLEQKVLPRIRPAADLEIELRLSEPLDIRFELKERIRRLVIERGADPGRTAVTVLCAHKQGLSWICDSLLPNLQGAVEIRIVFREHTPAPNSVDSPLRWLQELYPVDEILARELRIPLDKISFEKRPESLACYEVTALDRDGAVLLHSTFDPLSVTRPMFDLFPDYAESLVATGCIRARCGDQNLVDERIPTDPERVWNVFQSSTLPKIHDYILQLYNGHPNPQCAPHFGELSIRVGLSEPDYRLGIDEERVSTLEALHEDFYFHSLLFFDVLGSETAGKPLSYPGRIIPRIEPSRRGPGRLQVRLTGRNVPKAPDSVIPAPATLGITLKDNAESIVELDLRVQAGKHLALRIPSFEKVDCLRLICPDGTLTIPASEAVLRNTVPRITPSVQNTPGETAVQWETPIAPDECARIIARLAAFPEVYPYLAGVSFLGQNIWAMDVMRPLHGSYISQPKLAVSKPSLFITGRQHANEVSSTSHILRFVELLVTRPEYKRLLDRVNFVIHPIANPDGAALVDDLGRSTPDFMLHACYLGSLGVDVTHQQWEDCPKYPEARVRADLWRAWQPDILLNPHGYPSHEWVQLFAGYSAWVRSRTFIARDWWIPRGWFLPGLSYASNRRSQVFRWLNGVEKTIEASMGDLNARMYARYQRYGRFAPETYEMCFHGKLLAYLREVEPTSLQESKTWLNVVSEVPDEVARGEWLKMVAEAGLAASIVTAQFLAENPVSILRTVEQAGDGLVFNFQRSSDHDV